jgi:hypothetical protein
MAKKDESLLPRIPLAEIHWYEVPGRFDDRTIRRIERFLAETEFTSLREKVYVTATVIREDMDLALTEVEFSCLFGRLGGWSQSMISRYLRQLHCEKPAKKGRPKLVDSESEANLIDFCLRSQAE